MYQCKQQGLAAARGTDPADGWSSLVPATFPDGLTLLLSATHGMDRNGSQLQTPVPGQRQEGGTLDLCLSLL